MSPSHSEQAPLFKFYRMFGASVAPPPPHTQGRIISSLKPVLQSWSLNWNRNRNCDVSLGFGSGSGFGSRCKKAPKMGLIPYVVLT
jgi:hypothetical protein